MAMNNEAEFYAAGESVDHTPSGALTAGDVVQVQGELAGIVPTGGIAISTAGAIVTKGIAKVACVGVAMSAGAIIGWDENGTPYGGSTTGACTNRLADADFVMGTLVAAVTATQGYAYVALNKYPSWWGLLQSSTFESISASTKTLDIQDVGKVMQCTVASTVTLPAIAAGFRFIIQNIAADAAVLVAVDPNASDRIMGPDWGGVDNKDALLTAATSKTGDFIVLQYGSADGYLINNKRGIWAAEA